MWIASGISIVGGALTAGSVNIAMFLVFRFVTGLGNGSIIAMVGLYNTEVAPKRYRGFLAGMTVMGFGTGYVL